MPPFRLTRRALLKMMLGTTMVGAGGYLYGFYIEPAWIELTRLRLTLPRLDAAFDGYRIAQMSDIHADAEFMQAERMHDIVKQVNDLAPDLILITGDFVRGARLTPLEGGLISALSRLSAPDGVFAVLGNHDHWMNAAGVRRILAQSGVGELRNGVTTLRRGSAMLHIAGVDDVWLRVDRLRDVLPQIPAGGAAILMAHEPDFADISATTGRFDLQLSGHSHGGQVQFPGIGPLILPYLGEKYHTGLYQVGSMIQYTNRGLGMIKPQVRVNCRPELTEITLASPAI